MLAVFAVVHSGLAGLRTYAEPVVGARRVARRICRRQSCRWPFRASAFFVNRAHEGVQLWEAPTDLPVIHAALWWTNFVSFLFLYPSTFKFARNRRHRAAAVAPTGVISHHAAPAVCRTVLVWCAARTLWLGTSTAAAILVLHHAFSVYRGDRRLRDRHGAAFEYIQNSTSVVPLAAILDGRQQLPPDYYKEFLRLPYQVVIGGTTAAYFAHPFMQAGAALLLDW